MNTLRVKLVVGRARLYCLDDLLIFLCVVLLAVYVNLEYIQDYMGDNAKQSVEEVAELKSSESLAVKLEREVRVVCWILTTPKNHQTKAKAVRDTWGKHCSRLIFVSSAAEPDWEDCEFYLPPIEDTYQNLWGKTYEAFKYVYANYRDEADWFLKADDDTYIFMENLRYMLYQYSPDYPVHFGHAYMYEDMLYHSGGSGYVLSREALRRLNEWGLVDPAKCKQDITGAEDLEMGMCLFHSDVVGGDTRDPQYRQRFMPFRPADAMISNPKTKDFWFWPKTWHYTRTWRTALSNYSIAFHYIEAGELYFFDYIKRQVSVVGQRKPLEVLPPKMPANHFEIPASDGMLRLQPN